MQVVMRLAQILTCPLLPAGAVFSDAATVRDLVVHHAGLIVFAFAVAFFAATAWLEARRGALQAQQP